MQSLAEQYRPTKWEDVAGQDKAIKKIRTVMKRGVGSHAWWIAGQSGTGKTTIAGEIADEAAGMVEELDASELTPAKLREVESRMALYGMGSKPGRAFIVNEAHGLRKDTIRQLLVLPERLPDHVTMIFTTTCDGQEQLFDDQIDSSPLLSRCLRINLSRTDLNTAFAKRAKEIAAAEGLDGKELNSYKVLVRRHRHNLRAALQAIEAGQMLDD